ncbi:hypothetical protein GTW98_10945 [Streptomyces sp. SID8375]|uniref:hypothetical protein n=1 Tax=Streptomyces TaxID=1883 RepID=UPI00039DC691|nr:MULTISPECIES: hypothetical protein [unclassified Streptomyces]MYX07321.1 hypothetical protein [Streptomyces sp. SID8375]
MRRPSATAASTSAATTWWSRPGSAGRTNANGNLVTETLWNLTGPGLEAAAAVLDRPVREMGGTARGAARSGAKHAVKVTDTLLWRPVRPCLRPRRTPRWCG